MIGVNDTCRGEHGCFFAVVFSVWLVFLVFILECQALFGYGAEASVRFVQGRASSADHTVLIIMLVRLIGQPLALFAWAFFLTFLFDNRLYTRPGPPFLALRIACSLGFTWGLGSLTTLCFNMALYDIVSYSTLWSVAYTIAILHGIGFFLASHSGARASAKVALHQQATSAAESFFSSRDRR